MELKRGVVQQLLKGEKTLAVVSRKLHLQPSMVRQWKRHFEAGVTAAIATNEDVVPVSALLEAQCGLHRALLRHALPAAAVHRSYGKQDFVRGPICSGRSSTTRFAITREEHDGRGPRLESTVLRRRIPRGRGRISRRSESVPRERGGRVEFEVATDHPPSANF